MSRGMKIYENRKLHRTANALRLKAFTLIIIMTIFTFVLLFSNKESAEFSVYLVLSIAMLTIGFWFLFQTFHFRDFKVFENGIQLPVHKSKDYSLRRFVPFSDISVIEVSYGNRNMIVHYRDRGGRGKSVMLWRMDVERGFNELVRILKERTVVVDA